MSGPGKGIARRPAGKPAPVPVVESGKYRPGAKMWAFLSVAGWVGDGALTRGPLIVMLIMYPAGLVAALLGDPTVIGILGTCAAALAYAVGKRSGNRDWAIRLVTMVTSGVIWLLLCKHAGPAGYFSKPMLLGYVVACTVLWLVLFSAPHVVGRHTGKKDGSKWKMFAEQIGLEGSTVQSAKRTRLGYEIVVNIVNTGKTASKVVGKTLNETLAGKLALPGGRVLSRANPKNAGQVILTVRTQDPWATPVPHPMATAAARDGAPETSVESPIVIGEDPESGNAMTIQLVTKEGGVHHVIVAGTRGGKTTLLNGVIEFLTRARDVYVRMIDVSKGKDGRAWIPAVHDAAMGPDAVEHALQILRNAKALIVRRAASNPDAVHRVTKRAPAEVIILDEASELLGRKDEVGIEARSLVAFIEGKGASEAVIILIAAQRGVLAHLGTGDVKANAMVRVVLGVSQSSEMHFIVPDWEDRGMPDMSTYGEGAKGVALIAPSGGAWFAGRIFDLSDLDTVRAIAAGRVLPGNSAPDPTERVHAGVGDDPLMVERSPDGVDDDDVDEAVATPEPAANESGTGKGVLATDKLDGHEDDDGSVADLAMAKGGRDGAGGQDRAAAAKAAAMAAGAAADAALAELAGLGPAETQRRWLAKAAAVAKADRDVPLAADAVERVLELATMAGLAGFTRADLEESTGLGRSACASDLRVLTAQGYLVRGRSGKSYRYTLNMDRNYEE